MGYYLNVLQKGQMYELDGQKLEFIEKYGSRFYFYVCKMDEWSFKYIKTNEKKSFEHKEINFIKRFQDEPQKIGLRKVGRDKVFPRY